MRKGDFRMSDSKTLIWTMDIDTLEEFYVRATERNAQTEEEKAQILLELAQEGRMKSVSSTARSKDQIISDLKKNFNVATSDDIIGD
jgi:hypothetical protein